MPYRSTIVVNDPLTAHRVRTESARDGRWGRRVVTLPALAAHLAGGFARSVTVVDLRRALQDPPVVELGSLAEIADLPGFARAAASTLQSLWAAGLDAGSIAAEPGAAQRWSEIAVLERHVRTELPPSVRTPPALVAAALARLPHARRILGAVHLERVEEVAPVYRPLVTAIADVVPVTWRSPAWVRPAWAPDTIDVDVPTAASPTVDYVECADAAHEVLEAFRWVRRRLAEGVVPADIAIASASVEEYDAVVAAMASEADLPIHTAHGVLALATAEGQAAAALADLLIRGLSLERVRRFVDAARVHGPSELRALPPVWARVFPEDAALTTADRWRRAVAVVPSQAWPSEAPYDDLLLELVTSAAAGTVAAGDCGERWLSGRSRALWRRALDEGPAAAVDVSLQHVRVEDGVDPAAAVVWAPAGWLIGSPRPFVWLLGLASQTWPRRSAEDTLLPHHVLDARVLHERTMAQRDRAHFATLLGTTATEVNVSRPRRGADGRRRAASPLVRAWSETVRRLRPRDPTPHAMSEADRRASRIGDLWDDPYARSAASAWHGWHSPELTPHDGVVRAHHPAVLRALDRVHSASSLRMLLRDPQGFIARYSLGWREPHLGDEPLLLDAVALGNLVHQVLQRTMNGLEADGGFAGADTARLQAAVERATETAAADWMIEQPVPPPILWRATLDDVRQLVLVALEHDFPPLSGQRTFVEVPFGRTSTNADAPNGETKASPWALDVPVYVPGTDVELQGYIDRLDLSADGQVARVIDYKTGRGSFRRNLEEGAELQRALYASAARSLLGGAVRVEAYLLRLRSGEAIPLDDPDEVLAQLAAALEEASSLLLAGHAVPGPDTFGDYARHLLSLPADAKTGYRERKAPAIGAARKRLDAILGGSA